MTVMRLSFGVLVLAAVTVIAEPPAAQGYYRGKSITLFAGQPPASGVVVPIVQFYDMEKGVPRLLDLVTDPREKALVETPRELALAALWERVANRIANDLW